MCQSQLVPTLCSLLQATDDATTAAEACACLLHLSQCTFPGDPPGARNLLTCADAWMRIQLRWARPPCCTQTPRRCSPPCWDRTSRPLRRAVREH